MKDPYVLNWLPFGIKATPRIFQNFMDTLLNDVDFEIANLDDILIKNEKWEQHAKHVKEVLERIKQYGSNLVWINGKF